MRLIETDVQRNTLLDWPTEGEVIDVVGHAAGLTRNKTELEHEAAKRRVLQCISMGHHSVLEHVNLSVLAFVDRGTSHALVRHRHCAVTQESTIYSKYGDECVFVSLPVEDPVTHKQVPVPAGHAVMLEQAEANYKDLLKQGMPASIARDVLPNALATKLVITTNLREWYHIAHVRMSEADSVRMHVFADKLYHLLLTFYPMITDAMEWWRREGQMTV